MKKVLIRVMSLSLCLVMVISCFSFLTSAAKVTYKTGANGVSDAYKGSKYYKNLTQIELTGDGVTDTLAVALSQLEYVEGTSSSGFSGTQGGGGNFTEFCRNYGEGSAYAWCAAYVSFCLFQSGATNSTEKQTVWRDIYCPRWYQNMKNAGYGHDAGSNYTPKSGDLVFFTGGGHIGIVRYVKDGRVYTIEGNTSNSAGLNPEGGGVYCKSYDRSYSKFLGFGTPPYKVNNNALKVDYTGANPTTGLWISDTVKYLYPDTKLSNTSKYSQIPKGTIFEVTEIVSKTCFKVKYDGKVGYVSVNSASPIYQVTATKPPEPPVEKNTYYISKEIKKISGHFGSGISKYYVGTKGSTKVKELFEVSADKTIGIEGFAGFDSFAKKFGYYFDNAEANMVLDSIPLDPDYQTKKKGGDKTSEFKINAPVSSLTDGEHTVTFVVQLLNKKVHPLITLNINVTGSSANATDSATDSVTDELDDTTAQLPDDSEEITEESEEVTEDMGGCADDMTNSESNSEEDTAKEEENSDEDADKEDDKNADEDEDEDEDGKSNKTGKKGVTTEGCGASVAVAAIAPMILAAGAVIVKKKKD